MRRSVPAAITFALVLGLVLASSAFASSCPSSGSPELLNFQGISSLDPLHPVQVGSFYNGGGLPQTCNFGVTFSSNVYGMKPISMGGPGNFAPTPTQTPAIFVIGNFGTTITGTMDVSSGFANGLNFYYTAGMTETVTVWSGADGTGAILASISLGNNNASCGASGFCIWSNAQISFSGTAKSVTFTGPADEFGIADITLNRNQTAVPEPSTVYLFGAGLFGVAASRIRRFFTS